MPKPVKDVNLETVFSGSRWEAAIVRDLLENMGIGVTVYACNGSPAKKTNPWSAVNVRVAVNDFNKAVEAILECKES